MICSDEPLGNVFGFDSLRRDKTIATFSFTGEAGYYNMQLSEYNYRLLHSVTHLADRFGIALRAVLNDELADELGAWGWELEYPEYNSTLFIRCPDNDKYWKKDSHLTHLWNEDGEQLPDSVIYHHEQKGKGRKRL